MSRSSGTIFHFATLHPNDLLLCLATGGLSLLWAEVLKFVRRRLKRIEIGGLASNGTPGH